MDENDPVMKMYEAQAIAIEKEQELEERTRELEEARREIEQLRVTTQQMDENDRLQMYEAQAIEREQEIENKTRELEEAQREIERLRVTSSKSSDDKTAENVKLQETVAGINRRNEAGTASYSKSSLYVKNLHPEVNKTMLLKKFSAAGHILSVRVCRDKVSRIPLCYAYVNFQQPADAERALNTMNSDVLHGRPMEILWSKHDPATHRSAQLASHFANPIQKPQRGFVGRGNGLARGTRMTQGRAWGMQGQQYGQPFMMQGSGPIYPQFSQGGSQQFTRGGSQQALRFAQEETQRERVQKIQFREAIAEMEQNVSAKFENIHLQFSNLQQAFDEKTAGNLQETVAGINRRNLYISAMIFGGYCNNIRTDSICLYNSKEKRWINSPLKLPGKLKSHGSVILNGEIYIFGGCNDNFCLKSTYKLGENREWIKLADMNIERWNFGSLAFDDEIWVFGGRSEKTIEKYNPQTNTWTFMHEMNQAKSFFAVSLINGKCYVSGGYDENGLDKIEVFDPQKNKWEFFCNMPFGLWGHTSTVDGTNLIIIGGNKSVRELSNEVWKIDVLDPKKEWKKMPNLQQERYGHNAVKLEDGLMVIGGKTNVRTEIDSVEIFDGQKWKKGPKLPEMRCDFSLFPLTRKNEKKFLRFCHKRFK